MKFIYLLIGLVVFGSCVDEAVKDDGPKVETTRSSSGLSESEQAIEPLKSIVDKKKFVNGIQIQWFEKGKGPRLEVGNMYELNYKVKLNDGKIIDGNFAIGKDWLPYLFGFNTQTPGWDIAMAELHEGDFVEIYLPSKLARGKEGIPGKVPPNSPNILFMRVGKKIAPDKFQDGVKVWIHERREDIKVGVIGENSEVAFHYFVGTKSNPRYDNSYQRDMPFTCRMTDPSLIPGLKIGLKGVHMYDKCTILVPASKAYGSRGYVDLVKPNEELVYDMLVVDVDRKSIEVQDKLKNTH